MKERQRALSQVQQAISTRRRRVREGAPPPIDDSGKQQRIAKFSEQVAEYDQRIAKLDEEIAYQQSKIEDARNMSHDEWKSRRRQLFAQLDKLTQRRGRVRRERNQSVRNLNRAKAGQRRERDQMTSSGDVSITSTEERRQTQIMGDAYTRAAKAKVNMLEKEAYGRALDIPVAQARRADIALLRKALDDKNRMTGERAAVVMNRALANQTDVNAAIGTKSRVMATYAGIEPKQEPRIPERAAVPKDFGLAPFQKFIKETRGSSWYSKQQLATRVANPVLWGMPAPGMSESFAGVMRKEAKYRAEQADDLIQPLVRARQKQVEDTPIIGTMAKLSPTYQLSKPVAERPVRFAYEMGEGAAVGFVGGLALQGIGKVVPKGLSLARKVPAIRTITTPPNFLTRTRTFQRSSKLFRRTGGTRSMAQGALLGTYIGSEAVGVALAPEGQRGTRAAQAVGGFAGFGVGAAASSRVPSQFRLYKSLRTTKRELKTFQQERGTFEMPATQSYEYKDAATLQWLKMEPVQRGYVTDRIPIEVQGYKFRGSQRQTVLARDDQVDIIYDPNTLRLARRLGWKSKEDWGVYIKARRMMWDAKQSNQDIRPIVRRAARLSPGEKVLRQGERRDLDLQLYGFTRPADSRLSIKPGSIRAKEYQRSLIEYTDPYKPEKVPEAPELLKPPSRSFSLRLGKRGQFAANLFTQRWRPQTFTGRYGPATFEPMRRPAPILRDKTLKARTRSRLRLAIATVPSTRAESVYQAATIRTPNIEADAKIIQINIPSQRISLVSRSAFQFRNMFAFARPPSRPKEPQRPTTAIPPTRTPRYKKNTTLLPGAVTLPRLGGGGGGKAPKRRKKRGYGRTQSLVVSFGLFKGRKGYDPTGLVLRGL